VEIAEIGDKEKMVDLPILPFRGLGSFKTKITSRAEESARKNEEKVYLI
jgi:hypothetical protein